MLFPLLLSALTAALLLWGYLIRRRFLALKARADCAWEEIQSLLQRRYDLILTLVERLRALNPSEGPALQAVLEARKAALRVSDPSRKSAAENTMQQEIRTLLDRGPAPSGPDADPLLRELAGELTDLEERIHLARRYFNWLVRNYNAHMGSFPGLFVARLFQMKERAPFDIGDLSLSGPLQIRF